MDVVDVGQESGSGGGPTDEAREPLMAFPRLIPVPDSPRLPVQLPPGPAVEDTGETAVSYSRNCAPSQTPVSDAANYDRLSCGQLREL